MMSCEEFTSHISDFLDGRLPSGKKMGMWLHRLLCVRCRNYLRQTRELVTFIGAHGRAPKIPLDDKVRSELVERFRQDP